MKQAIQADALPRVPGTYTLLLHVDNPRTVAVGRLGTAVLLPGWLLYVGSAFGSGGLAARIGHHLRPTPKPHWHVDYLRAALPLEEIWLCASPLPLEHRFAAALHRAPGSSIPLPRCGASDCRCAAHLFHFTVRPTPQLLAAESPPALQVFRCTETVPG